MAKFKQRDGNPALCTLSEVDGPCKPVFCGGLCSKHYERRRRNGDPLITVHAPPGEGKRWMDAQLASGRDRSVCWLDWPFGVSGHGYPAIDGEVAGRYMLEADGRPCPPKPANFMRHGCDTPLCLSPWCPSWGTARDNAEDMVRSGRQTSGERNAQAKLTDELAMEIRASDLPASILAARYGVTQASIRNARSGRTWRHLP